MNRQDKALKPPSLAQHFEAPDDYIGCFGWVLGYSADASFLDDAMERFTRLTRSQRAHQGRIALAVFLDPGNPHISLLDVPGAAHLPIKDVQSKPFRLLHAKVALLGFQHHDKPEKWKLRLLVSTGNWTRQTVEESLDLAWRIDLGDESINQPDDDTRRDCADIKAAWALITWIRELFNSELLDVSTKYHQSESAMAQAKVLNWISACEKRARGQARFFDNRSRSLLAQLASKIKADSEVKRNYLALGSGFYESPKLPHGTPEIPIAIIDSLRNSGLLTEKPAIDLYVNPSACQSIATAVPALRDLSITIRPAVTPLTIFNEGTQRGLHAKFLFSANTRENSNSCSSAWIYLGSGNLTHPGFASRANPSSGNLEAGVVFSPPSLYWYEDRSNPKHPVVTDLLPIQWDSEAEDETALSEGAEWEPREMIYIAPPMVCLFWYEADGLRELRPSGWPETPIDVLGSTEIPCPRTDTGYIWSDSQPRVVNIRWKTDAGFLVAQIPVIDPYGRIAATELSSLEIDEAWWQLAAFPMQPEDDEETREGNDGMSPRHYQASSAPVCGYPIRQMMSLIESIAAKQIEIGEEDWSLWCNRLEQALGQASKSAHVKYFCEELKINPLSPLRQPSFRPSFAETEQSAPGKLYDDILTRIEASWQVNELDSIGGNK